MVLETKYASRNIGGDVFYTRKDETRMVHWMNAKKVTTDDFVASS